MSGASVISTLSKYSLHTLLTVLITKAVDIWPVERTAVIVPPAPPQSINLA